MGRRTLLLITSVLLAAVGTAMVALYVREADNRATRNEATASFVVAGRTIEAGDTITAQDLQVQVKRASDQATSAVRSQEAVIGRRATAQILEGTTLDQRAIAPEGADADVEAAVRENELGVNVLLQDPNRAVSLLGIGSFVRVFTMGEDDEAMPLVSAARVISIGATVEATGAVGPDGLNSVGSDAVPAAIVGLSLPQDDAKKIMKAQMLQQPLYFAVLNRADVTVEN